MVKRPKSPKSVPLKRDVDLPLVSRPIFPPDTRQARLPFDPMPTRIEPCLAKLTDRVAGEAIFYAFDLLYLDGYDLTKLSQHERRQMLQDLLEGQEARSGYRKQSRQTARNC